MSELEAVPYYASGGYHPVHLGDTYHNGRYKIEHKLGVGSTSTVWLAREAHEQRYVALKILMAGLTSTHRQSSELLLLRHLS